MHAEHDPDSRKACPREVGDRESSGLNETEERWLADRGQPGPAGSRQGPTGADRGQGPTETDGGRQSPVCYRINDAAAAAIASALTRSMSSRGGA